MRSALALHKALRSLGECLFDGGTVEDHALLVHLLQSGQNKETVKALFHSLEIGIDGPVSRDDWERCLRHDSEDMHAGLDQPSSPKSTEGVPEEPDEAPDAPEDVPEDAPGKGALRLLDVPMFGARTFACGDKYEGEWLNGQREGRGVFTFVDGAVYDGEWKDDIMHGSGTMRFAYGDV